jgi:SRSO17 transposase
MPQAPPQPLPELAEFLAPFHVHFRRSEGRHSLERYLTGLLIEHPNKNCDTLATAVPGTSQQRLQGLLTAIQWDEDDLNHQRVQRLLTLPTEGDGVLIFDDVGFPKQGKSSVGAAHQYCGALGKTANCQVAVDCVYAERTLAWPVACRLYLPKDWAFDAGRRAKAKVAEDITFQTKPQIALALLDQANAWGVPHACVVADADYGDNHNCLNGLEGRRERYVVDVRADFAVVRSRRADETPQAAEALMDGLPAGAWQSVRWREGSKGWLGARFAAVRCWRVDGPGIRHIGWLIGQRPYAGQSGDVKFSWSNFGQQASLAEMVEYAHRRHWVERFHEESKGLLGWDQYQGRLWPGFQRNAVAVMLAYSFLVWQEWQERQERRVPGRQRRAFSPSAGPASAVPA